MSDAALIFPSNPTEESQIVKPAYKSTEFRTNSDKNAVDMTFCEESKGSEGLQQ